MYEIVTQVIGFIAMALCIGCFQFKNSRTLVLCQMAGNIIYVIHYLMLGAYSGCASLLLTAVNNAVLSGKNNRWARWVGWKWVFSTLFVVSCIATWQNLFSLIPCAASIVSILTNWSGNGKKIRFGKLFLIGPGWIIYNIYVRSYSGILCELIGMGSAWISIRRYGIKELDKVD